jgi:hypothetical protein
MDQKGLRAGHLLGLGGAGLALVSLWRPWYTLEIPAAFRDALSSESAKTPGPIGQFAQGIAAAIPDTIAASGWDELKGADVAVCVLALAIAALVIGAAGAFGSAVRVDPAAAARGIAGLGAGVTGIVLVHAVQRPFDADLVHPAAGLWIALAGGLLALAGGLAATGPAGRERSAGAGRTPDAAFPRLEPPLPALFDTPRPASASVPPPGSGWVGHSESRAGGSPGRALEHPPD